MGATEGVSGEAVGEQTRKSMNPTIRVERRFSIGEGVRNPVRTELIMATIADACTHHFIIETPQPRMPKVKGTCTRCGKESQFPAYQNPEDMSYAERHYLAMSGARRRKK